MTPTDQHAAARGGSAPRRDGHARYRLRILSALSVALVAVGCAPPGTSVPDSVTNAMRQTLPATESRPYPVSYLRAGSTTGPRLVLVHGTPGSASAWADYLTDVPPGWEVVALDRPGFGHSGPAAAVVGLAEQAAAVEALLPLDGRAVVLLGHSLGGAVIARVAAARPGRVSALVMLAASLDPQLEEIHPAQRVGAWAPVRGLLPRVLRNANAELLALKSELEELLPMLATITSRVVIVHGTKDDLVPVANVDFMQAHFARARCMTTLLLEGRNHFLPWNSADAVRAALRMALEQPC